MVYLLKIVIFHVKYPGGRLPPNFVVFRILKQTYVPGKGDDSLTTHEDIFIAHLSHASPAPMLSSTKIGGPRHQRVKGFQTSTP